jgi:hypothetical protein
VLTLADWRGPEPVPSRLLRTGWHRCVRAAARNAPDAMTIHLAIEPWSMLLDRIQEERYPADEGKLAVTVDAGTCAIVSVEAIRNEWGQTAAGVIVTALRTGLGRVINVWDPGDIEWVAEWWQDSMEIYCDEEDAAEKKAEEARIKEFAAAQKHVRATYLEFASRSELSDALKALPTGPIRRSAAALLTSSRRPRKLWPSRAWDRMQTGEEGYATAAVLMTRCANDAVYHAYEEMQERSMNSGFGSPEHGLILLDTSTPSRLTASIRHLHRVLRTLAWGEHLVHAILELQDSS